MGKITEALKKVAQDRMARLEKMDKHEEVKYTFIAKKTVESKIDPRIVTFYDSKSSVAEQYRTLRTNIQSIESKRPIKMIAIASSTNKEGKTITSINLAISMALDLNKKKILLMDGDLRRASVSKYLGLSSKKGLVDLIYNGKNVDDALLDIGIENLTILPVGKIPSNPAELLGSAKMKNLFSTLRTKYDYVIVDTPPIVSVTDAGIIGAQVDGVIMVVQAGRTQKGVIKHSQTLFRQAQAKILGYILTNVQYHIPAYIYRYL
ncbi:CpsD/CapB family tyrosine-protein kinase [Candidatus Omnitrophota bacterium]